MNTPFRKPATAGEILREEYMALLDISQTKLAELMGVSRKTVNELCNDKMGVSVELSYMLAKVFNTTPEYWLNIQRLTDMWVVEHSKKSLDRLEKVQKYQQNKNPRAA